MSDVGDGKDEGDGNDEGVSSGGHDRGNAGSSGGSNDPSEEPEIKARPERHVLEFLVCPVTRHPLLYDRVRDELVSRQARLAYPIRDGVPIMVVSEARTLEDDERPGFGPPGQPR